MTVYEKLKRLTEFCNKSAISKAAGLSSSTLGSILANKPSITIPTAAALARVLRVDVAWLIDDSKGWPPVRVESSEPVTSSAA
ncbi:MAG TPA: helix-turn-helix transcriptional regulator [Phycisphaerae bacterium]|nr:helix-turn-helix transcriptional regulator [Phycisphaerae bacterium]